MHRFCLRIILPMFYSSLFYVTLVNNDNTHMHVLKIHDKCVIKRNVSFKSYKL